MGKKKIKNWPRKFKKYKKRLVEQDLSRVAGLYFLLDSGKIVYVGNSTNVYQRISYHYTQKDFVFTNAMALFISDKYVRDIMEKEFIEIILPRYNIQYNKNQKYDPPRRTNP